MARQLYPIGIQTFSKIREGGLVYVDKTSYIARLVSTAQFVFLSRPRIFGKSLLLSTIKELFSGKRELFDGLDITHTNYAWEEYPVLHLDFTGNDYNDPDGLYSNLNGLFEGWEEKYGITRTDRSLSERFREIILRVCEQTGRKAVILIDEYDKPLLETVDNPELQQKFRNTLRGVYGNLKRMDQYIRFAMLTGVTKFGHLSIFSDLNNLTDISMRKEYAGICGITTEELHKYFETGVSHLAKDNNLTHEEVFSRLQEMYDGYHFSPTRFVDIYNPFSILNALDSGEFGDYWFQTGTPTFLIKMIKEGKMPLQELSELNTGLNALTDVSFDLGNYTAVLYQSGYLTIKKYDTRFNSVTLGFPNKEVERGFMEQLLPYYTSLSSPKSSFEISQFVLDV